MNSHNKQEAWFTKPTWQILFAAIRQQPLPQDPAEVDGFLPFLEHHRLVPWFYRESLKRAWVDLHKPFWQVLKQRQDFYQRRALTQLAALIEIQKIFDQHQIDMLTIKGVVLSQQLYGDIAVRQSKDVDILIPQAQVWQAHELLLLLGYKLYQAKVDIKQQDLPFILKHLKDLEYIHPVTKVNIELHWQLQFKMKWFLLDQKIAWLNRQSIVVDGYIFQTLSDVDHMVYLSYHGSRHAWLRGQWTMDLVRFMQYPPSRESRLLSQATNYQCRRPWLIGSALVRFFLNQPYSMQEQMDPKLPWLLKQASNGMNECWWTKWGGHQYVYIANISPFGFDGRSLFGSLTVFYAQVWLRNGWSKRWFWIHIGLEPFRLCYRLWLKIRG